MNILQSCNVPFPVTPLPYEGAMKILYDQSYNDLPTAVVLDLCGTSLKSPEVTRFYEDFYLRRRSNKEEVVNNANKIITRKYATIKNLPLTVKEQK